MSKGMNVRPLRPYVMGDDDEEGADDAARVSDAPRRTLSVRPFLVTAGRVAADTDAASLPLETQVVATAAGLAALDTLSFEHHDIVAACRRPQSLAELAARLHLHLNVVRVLSADLRTAEHLTVYAPQAGAHQDVSVLRRVIDGLRAVPDSRGLPRDSDRPA